MGTVEHSVVSTATVIHWLNANLLHASLLQTAFHVENRPQHSTLPKRPRQVSVTPFELVPGWPGGKGPSPGGKAWERIVLSYHALFLPYLTCDKVYVADAKDQAMVGRVPLRLGQPALQDGASWRAAAASHTPHTAISTARRQICSSLTAAAG
jgi:hypothetical protein